MNRHENLDPAAGWLDRLCHLNAVTTPWLPYSPELFFRFQCYGATTSPAP